MIAEQLEPRCYLSGDPIVQVDTNFGNFQIELLPSAAPQSVANFLSYVDSGAYTDTIFHRSVQQGIGIVQAGGFTSASTTFTSTSQFQTIPTHAPIPLEYNLQNSVGTVAMARTSDANSATDEFFINDTDNSTSLGQSNGGGYAVFGKILGTGMQDVVDKIAALPTTAADSGNFATLPLGPNNELVQISSITLLDGVYGNVFTDTNGNGTLDSQETGIANRTVFVNVDGTGQPTNNPSAVTDANGNYVIPAILAGKYQVEEVLPSGVHATTPLQTITFSTSLPAANINFGEGPSITGTVFTDLNADGKFDNGDPGVAGRTVFIDNDGTGKPDPNNPSATTGADGSFAFSGVAAGTYKVTEVAPSGVAISTNTQSIVVKQNQPAATANIGEQSSIMGIVFNDLKVNGSFDSTDPGIAGVTVFLNNDNTGKPDSKNPSTTTDGLGRFYFGGLANGPYTVEQVSANGLTSTTSTAAVSVASGSPPPTVTLGDVLTSPIAPVPVSTPRPAAASNANTAYINALYQYVLGRAPDSDGLTFWQAQLGSTTPSAATLNSVADGFWTSPEHRSFQVEQYFLEFLGRPYDADGKNTWMSNFTSKTTGPATNDETAAIGFLTTAEYQALHSGNTALVDALYNDIELHAADPANTWVTQLNSGAVTYAQVVKDFVDGAEANTRLVDSLYSVFLHRAPDSSDLSGLVNELNSGTLNADGAAIKLLSSTELYNDAQAPQFITPSSATFTAGTAGSFTVKTSGVIGTITGSGLPASGLTLTDDHDGTATLASDTTLAAGTYNLQLTVTNSVGTAKQNFTLTVQ